MLQSPPTIDSLSATSPHSDSTLFVSDASIFGANSKLVISEYTGTEPLLSPTESIYTDIFQVFSILTLFTFCYFCFIIYYYRETFFVIIKNIFSLSKTLSRFNNDNKRINSFLVHAQILFFLWSANYLSVAYLEYINPLPDNPYLIFFLITLVFIFIFLYKQLIFRSCKLIGGIHDEFKILSIITQCNISFFAIISVPLSILFTYTEYHVSLTILSLISLFLFCNIKNFIFLRIKRFSFLQWFLYLCTVEVIPFMAIIAVIISTSTIF